MARAGRRSPAPPVAVGARASAVKTRIVAGEDVRAKVCVRAQVETGARSRCLTANVAGLRPANVAVEVSTTAATRVEVSVELAAESNRKRKTRVARETVLRP